MRGGIKMKKSLLIILLLIGTVSLFACSKEVPITEYEKLILSLENLGFSVVEEDVGEDILQGQRKWLTINDVENLSVYLYKTSEKMEEDASYIHEGGTSYSNGKNNAEISWVSYPHFYKRGNIIVLYVGENQEIINVLDETIGLQFAGMEIKYLSDRPPMVMIKGELYFDTNRESDNDGRCGVMDGEITSTVEGSEIPTQDNQSNFGDGYEYQFVDKNSVDIIINSKWIRFEKKISETWGIQLTTTKVTPYGLVLVCNQSGGEPTGDLQTGTSYFIEKQIGNEWIPVEMLPSEHNRAWHNLAWGIPMNDSVEWGVNWTELYGGLPDGNYRIGKVIHDFRGSGDYDEETYYAYFEVTN